MARPTFTLTLKSAHMIAPQVRHLIFENEGGANFNFTPGQFITLHIPYGEKPLNRSYSIATLEPNTPLIEFAAAHVENGVATQLLFNLQPGEQVTASGPFGRLILRDEKPTRYILMATGTGVTPYLTMLTELQKRLNEQPDLQVKLFFGVRCPEELLYRDIFVAFAAKNPRFEFRACYSRVLPENPQLYEHKGYVTQALASIDPNPQGDIIYLCGNPNMIDEAFAMLCERSFASQSIRREKYISSHST